MWWLVLITRNWAVFPMLAGFLFKTAEDLDVDTIPTLKKHLQGFWLEFRSYFRSHNPHLHACSSLWPRETDSFPDITWCLITSSREKYRLSGPFLMLFPNTSILLTLCSCRSRRTSRFLIKSEGPVWVGLCVCLCVSCVEANEQNMCRGKRGWKQNWTWIPI